MTDIRNFMSDGNQFEGSGAVFSRCRQYRYMLWRIWDKHKPFIQFIGLNPSTADEFTNDATIRRVIRFASAWGYGGAYMTNLFAIISTDPKVLKSCEDPVKDNDKYLLEAKSKCKTTLFAWGNFDVLGRDKQVMQMFDNPICLSKNKNGSPKHPLYCAANLSPIPFMS